MKTILRGISMRLSLIAMVLCLCAAWPGHGLAWGMVGSASLAGMTPGAPQSQAEGEVRFTSTLDPVAYCFIYEWNPVATWSLNFNIENFTKGMAIRVQLVNTANPDGVEFRFEDSEPAQTLDNGGFWIPDEKLTDYGYSVGLRLQMNSSKGCEAGYTVKVYSSQDISTAALASTGQTIRFMLSDKAPAMGEIVAYIRRSERGYPFCDQRDEGWFPAGATR